MSDSFTETTSVSWFGRIGRSIGGVVIGLLLVLGMIFLLFWNEGRAVTTARSLAEGASAVVSVQADAVDSAHEGKLVHVTGAVTTDTIPADPDFGISAKAIRLVRTSEMYQWKEESKSETTKKLGGGEETVTTYSYSKGWDDRPVNSSDFKRPDGHGNPGMEIRGTAFQVPAAKLGAFDLDQPVLDQMSGANGLAVRADQKAAVEQAFSGSTKVNILDGRIYLGSNPASPAVGDYRIGYEIVPVGDASIIAKQTGGRFTGYQTVAGDELLMVASGTVPADKMFADAVSVNTLVTWLLRAVGLVLLFIGFTLLMAPVGVLADIIPFLGSIVRLGTGIVAFFLAILVGATVIAFAWFWYRPLLALAIMAGGIVIAFAVVRLGRARRPAVAQPPAQSTVAPAPPPVVPSASAATPPGAAKPPGGIAW